MKIRALVPNKKLYFPHFRPMWWLSEDPEALCSGDQFVIDNTMVVAPILIEGATSRIVFLPDGVWEYELTHDIYRDQLN